MDVASAAESREKEFVSRTLLEIGLNGAAEPSFAFPKAL